MKKTIGIVLGVIIGIGAASSLVLDSQKPETEGTGNFPTEETDSAAQKQTLLKDFKRKAVKWSDHWSRN